MSNWISVDDSLPEVGKPVKIKSYCSEGVEWKTDGVYWGCSASQGDGECEVFRIWTLAGEMAVTACSVTHWMSLPEPPKDLK
ncbi:MAG: DUF551 domain-containing protein [Vibrio splendidus]